MAQPTVDVDAIVERIRGFQGVMRSLKSGGTLDVYENM